MRGKVELHALFRHPVRITPAYAGKSFLFLQAVCSFQDHPRVCGEKKIAETIAGRYKGSPPRMRGKGEIISNHFGVDRITPAYAGKSTQ